MFWNLLLAHFLGDFVFQTDWMVSKRDHLWVLTAHAGIHFALMFLLVGQTRSAIWPFLLLLSILHLLQDRLKNDLTNRRPDWVRKGFIIDQAFHFAIIWAIIYLFERVTGPVNFTDKPMGVLLTITYVFISYVWFIIERIFNLSDSDYLQYINKTKFPRMLSRAGLVSLFPLTWTWAKSGLAIIFSNPYPQSQFRRRAILTDVSVSLLAMVFLFWALR